MKYQLIAIGMICLMFNRIPAEIIRVPGQQPSIQDGIDAASETDTILVAPGTFAGEGNRDIDFTGKAILVVSESGAAATVINCEGSELEEHRGFRFFSGEGADSVLDGFTIKNGYTNSEGGGIYCNASDPTIINCIISANTGGDGGGIYLSESSATVADCRINGNSAPNDFGGGVCGMSSAVSISRCTIISNSAFYGGGIYCDIESPLINDCTISGNYATEFGGGVYFSCTADTPFVTTCLISDNTSREGGGIYNQYSPMALVNCTITGNSVENSGGGIFTRDTDSTEPSLKFCTVSANSASSGGGIVCDFSSPDIVNCIFWADSLDEIHESDGSPAVTFSDIEGGWPGLGNIDADPMFLDTGDYHLTQYSPCIDGGTDCGIVIDADGETRPQIDGFDIGSDEFVIKNMLVEAEAFDGDSLEPGIDDDDFVMLTFDEETIKPDINPINIDELLPLSGGHTWKDGFGEIGPVEWNTAGDKVLINLSTRIYLPTIAAGDTVFPHLPMIMDNPVVLGGSFGVTGVNDDEGGDGENPSNRSFGPRLDQNRPNPFNPETTITYFLEKESAVSLKIYGLNGALIKTLAFGSRRAGRHAVTWRGEDETGRNVSSGVYILKLVTGNHVESRRMLLLK